MERELLLVDQPLHVVSKDAHQLPAPGLDLSSRYSFASQMVKTARRW
jgi:hypothetical protein